MVSYPLPDDWSLKTIVLFIFLRHVLQDTRYKFPHSNTNNRRKNNTAHSGILCIIYRINYMQILYLKEGRNFYALIRVKTDLNPFNMSIFSEYRTIMMCCERGFFSEQANITYFMNIRLKAASFPNLEPDTLPASFWRAFDVLRDFPSQSMLTFPRHLTMMCFQRLSMDTAAALPMTRSVPACCVLHCRFVV